MLIHVVIYEDNVFLRKSIGDLILSSNQLGLLGSFENCDHVEEEMKTLQPDVVLMDIEMAGTDGLEGLKKIRKHSQKIHVIMLTVFDDNERVFEAICNGASGYLLKKTPPEKIVESVIDVVNGGAPMTSSIARKVLQLFPKAATGNNDEVNKLSLREQEVLQLLVNGNSYKMIASEMNITHQTVQTYIKRIYEKLQVHSATEAIAKAFPNRKV
ncbi:MAG TPA: response regulator transcription factor [Chitinophagales bacterium]|nr:response regulator transcription factor [Chitinophagales bacterium]